MGKCSAENMCLMLKSGIKCNKLGKGIQQLWTEEALKDLQTLLALTSINIYLIYTVKTMQVF